MPKPLSAVDCISPALERTKRQLFAPFRFRRWARLAIVCLITGEFAGGGGYTGGFNYQPTRSRGGHTALLLRPIDWRVLESFLPWIILGVGLLLLLILLWIYAAAVYRFVLFDSVVYDRCELKGSWSRWESAGRSYFFWCLSLFFTVWAALLVLIGGPVFLAWRAGIFQHPRAHLAPLILGGIALLFLVVVIFVTSAIVAVFAKDFCVAAHGDGKRGCA